LTGGLRSKLLGGERKLDRLREGGGGNTGKVQEKESAVSI